MRRAAVLLMVLGLSSFAYAGGLIAPKYQHTSKATSSYLAGSPTDVNVNITLTWTAGANATGRDIYFDTSNPPATLVSSLPSTSYHPETLEYSTTYYLRVNCFNGGFTSVGDVWSFTTQASPTPEAATWRSMPLRCEAEYNAGHNGGEGWQFIHSLARCSSDPNFIYASHDNGGIWRSTDGGDTWSPCKGFGLYQSNGGSVEVDPCDPNKVFCLVSHLWTGVYDNDMEYDGLFMSTDGGVNWTLKQAMEDTWFDWSNMRFHQHCIAFDWSTVDGSGAATWYAATPGNPTSAKQGKLYKSVDYGVTWSTVCSMGVHQAIRAIEVDVNGRVYLACEDGLFYLNVNTWDAIGDLSAGVVSSIWCHPTNADIIWAVRYNSVASKSINGGVNFTAKKTAGGVNNIDFSRTDPNFGSLATYTGNLYYTQDAGETWSSPDTTTYEGCNPHTSSIYGQMTGFLYSDYDANDVVAYGLYTFFKSVNGGAHWAESAVGFTGGAFGGSQTMKFHPTDPNRVVFGMADLFMYQSDSGGKYWTSDGALDANGASILLKSVSGPPYYSSGVDWLAEPGESTLALVSTMGAGPKSNNTLIWRDHAYVGAGDGGWVRATTGTGYRYWLGVDREDPNYVYAGGNGYASKKSTDKGVSYSDITFDAGSSPYIVNMSSFDPNVLWAASNSSTVILRSINKGVNWSVYASPKCKMNYDQWPVIVPDPRNSTTVYYSRVTLNMPNPPGEEGDIIKYDGATYTVHFDVSANVTAPATIYKMTGAFAIDPIHPEVQYVIVGPVGVDRVWRTTDDGATWESIQYNLHTHSINALTINPWSGEVIVGGLTGSYVLPPPYEADTYVYDHATVAIP